MISAALASPAFCHCGVRIREGDWSVFLGYAAAILTKGPGAGVDRREVVGFIESPMSVIVEERRRTRALIGQTAV